MKLKLSSIINVDKEVGNDECTGLLFGIIEGEIILARNPCRLPSDIVMETSKGFDGWVSDFYLFFFILCFGSVSNVPSFFIFRDGPWGLRNGPMTALMDG